MKTLEKCRDLLTQQPGVERVQIFNNEFVHAAFANRINPGQQHALIIHPVPGKKVLKVCVPHIAKITHGGEVFRFLCHLNYDTLVGKVGVDTDGEVRFEINHPCLDGTHDDPPEEIFARLVDTAMYMANRVVFLITLCAMMDAGVPRTLVEGFARQFGDQKPGGDAPSAPDSGASDSQDTL